MNIQRLLIAVALVLTASSGHLFGQDVHPGLDLPYTSMGHIYLVTFPEELSNVTDVRFAMPHQELSLQLYANRATDVVVLNRATGYLETVSVPAQETVTYQIPESQFSFVGGHLEITDNAYAVFSARPIQVTCYMNSTFGTDVWMPFPIETWGRSYYAAMTPAETVQDISTDESNLYGDPKGAPSQIVVTAAFDNTTVTVRPTGDMQLDDTSQSITFQLDGGESCRLLSDVDLLGHFGPDLSGTQIEANKIIGVLSGNTRASNVEPEGSGTYNSMRDMSLISLAPVEQHGTEFVYMPTRDEVRMTRVPGWLEVERPFESMSIIGTSPGRTSAYYTDTNGRRVSFSLNAGDKVTHSFRTLHAYTYRTDQPAQAMTSSAAFREFRGYTKESPDRGWSWRSFASRMCELIPVEQWTSKAAFQAPYSPAPMKHYLTVVALAKNRSDVYVIMGDSPLMPFQFDDTQGETIPGSEYVWGSIAVNPGIDYHILGKNGATFSGRIDGMLSGDELHRPDGTERKKDAVESSALHPSEYEEIVAKAYGVPLTHSRRSLGPKSAIDIEQSSDGASVKGEKQYHVTLSASSPELDSTISNGIRSITLGPDSYNAELQLDDPTERINLIGRREAWFRVAPVDPSKNAVAEVTVWDRAGHSESLPYSYDPTSSVGNRTSRSGGNYRMVAPNPVSRIATIEFSADQRVRASVSVVDALGRQVATLLDEDVSPGVQSVNWDVRSVAAGVYYCRILVGGERFVEKVVVE